MASIGIIWTVSLGLAGLSLTMLLLLVGRRVFVDRAALRDRLRSRELLTAILDLLDPEGSGFDFSRIGRRDRDLVAGLVDELMNLVRGEDLLRLTELLRGLGTVDAALVRLARGSEAERIRAAATLACFPEAPVPDALERALGDRSWAVRLAAAQALARLDQPPAFARVVAALDGVSGAHTRRLRSLYRELAAIDPGPAIALAQEAKQPATRLLLIDALGNCPDYRALPVLIATLADPNPDIRAAGFRSLSRLDPPDAARHVVRGLTDPAWPVRAQAALCAGRLGIDEAVPGLSRLLGDEEWWVRFRAAEALFALGEAGRTELLALAGQASAAGTIAQLILAEKGWAP